MGETTRIEWATATWNPVIGCQKVSQACTHCYAETYATQRLQRPELWRGDRHVTSASTWALPERVDRAAGRTGVRARLFVASLSDVFEDHLVWSGAGPEHVQIVRDRMELAYASWGDGTGQGSVRDIALRKLERLGHTDVLLLTKRPENVLRLVPRHWLDAWPRHVWVGTTVEDQATADERIPHLLRIPARVRFLSCEPLLGPVDLAPWLGGPVHIDQLIRTCGHFDGASPVNNGYGCRHPAQEEREDGHGKCYPFSCPVATSLYPDEEPEDAAILARHGHVGEGGEDWLFESPGIQWVIAGGESGPHARPSHPAWFRSLRNQCIAAGVPFLFKQWGEWATANGGPGGDLDLPPGETLAGRAGGFFDYSDRWNAGDFNPGRQSMARLGKRRAGRVLDGRTWDEIPAEVPRG